MKAKLLHFFKNYQSLVWGLLFPLGFAPFHIPFFLYIALLGFFYCLYQHHFKWTDGLLFGLGLGFVGLSWVYVSIHEYGHLHPALALLLTFLFIGFLSLFYGLFTLMCKYFQQKDFSPWLIASCWCATEWLRAHLFGGFPWLLLGFSVHHTPLENLLPWVGIYGASFVLVLGLASFAYVLNKSRYSVVYSILGVLLFLSPHYFLSMPKVESNTQIETAFIQGNVAMQDKWNQEYFWRQYSYYYNAIMRLLAPQRLIILPEAAISIPSGYIHQELAGINKKALQKNSAVLLGIPEASPHHSTHFYNALMGLGHAQGKYYKQQLVLFGEEIPKIWHPFFEALKIPLVTTLSGDSKQKPITIFGHPIASLICYEIAYPEILRLQLPTAEWIVAISDDGWFGHSFAMYQHLEMSQTLSIMSQRQQIFVNNNGLSSIINEKGDIVKQLPAFQSGTLKAFIKTSNTSVPWLSFGDYPCMFLAVFLLILSFSVKQIRRLKSNKAIPAH